MTVTLNTLPDDGFEADVAALLRDLAPIVILWPEADAMRRGYSFISGFAAVAGANLQNKRVAVGAPLPGAHEDEFLSICAVLDDLAWTAANLAGEPIMQPPPFGIEFGEPRDAFLASCWAARVTTAASTRTAKRIGTLDTRVAELATWLQAALGRLVHDLSSAKVA